MSVNWLKYRKRISEVIEVGSDLDFPSRAYDLVNVIAIVTNITVSILCTFSTLNQQYEALFGLLNTITIAFFAIDYCLRIWTARFHYPKLKEFHAIRTYMFSFTGLVDLLSFLPDLLPFFFPAGTVAFRMIRIARIFRLFRINAYYDSLNVITHVIASKRQQLFSSVFIILILMIASSLCMYSLEHEAQPDVFSNAFSGIWWAASTLLTVGYGDIYPITTLGKLFGIFISFLGVGMVAIPTGIISAGFIDQYSSLKKRAEYGYSADMDFIKVLLQENDEWIDMRIADLNLPAGMIIAAVRRREDIIIPRGDVILQKDDSIIIGAEPFADHDQITLTEMVLEDRHPWTNMRIRDLDISRHSIIVLIKRRNKSLIPNGNMILRDGDKIFMYTKLILNNTTEIEI